MGKEQREFERAELHVPAQYHLAGGLVSLWQQGTVLNLSATGLRLATSEPLERDTTIEVQLVLPIRKHPYVLLGAIASEQPRPGLHEYGVAFMNVTPEKGEEIDELVRFLHKADE